jgi:hypothetical protein
VKRNAYKRQQAEVARNELILAGWELRVKEVGVKKKSKRYLWCKRKGERDWVATTWYHSLISCTMRAVAVEHGTANKGTFTEMVQLTAPGGSLL